MKLSYLKDFNNLLNPIKNLILICLRKIDQLMLNNVDEFSIFPKNFIYIPKKTFKLVKKSKRINKYISYF